MLKGRACLPGDTPTVVAPDRVAALVALLCGPSGADITGSAIPIDGGWSAA
jgi:3-hydroxybutyrate dehydrogenase